ncbi:MAG: hypothetical protein LH645_00820 [Actinomycetia bacterium]|nr:hypothetical protein [Actinomycetes bacterium]
MVYPVAIDAVAREGGDIVIVSQDQQVCAGDYERQLGIDLSHYLAEVTRDRDALPVLLSPTSQDLDPRLTAFCHENDIALLCGARVGCTGTPDAAVPRGRTVPRAHRRRH